MTPDTKPPVFIESPQVVNKTHQSAVIRWKSDEQSDSLIEFGTTPFFGSSAGSAALVTRHNIPLTGLAAGTTYYFRVASKDAVGNGPTFSSTYTFTTDSTPDTKAPVITKMPEIIYSSNKSATVYFETDEPCDTVVEYGENSTLTNRQSDGDKVEKHQILLTNLMPNTSYRVQVSCTDLAGNTVIGKAGRPSTFLALNMANIFSDALFNVTGATGFLTQSLPDTVAPVITVNPVVNSITATQVTVIWTTDKIADSLVQYNVIGQPLNLSSGEISQVFSHSIVLTNLIPSTTYEYTVTSIDPSGNTITSQPLSFTTGSSVPVSISGVCGSSHATTVLTAPSNNLCTTGTASSVTGTGPWYWTCSGNNGGDTAPCNANIQTYNITATVTGGNGTVNCTSPVNSGATSTCTVTPAVGYQLATFTDNSVDKKSGSSLYCVGIAFSSFAK